MSNESSRRYLGLTAQDWLDALTAGASFLVARYVVAHQVPVAASEHLDETHVAAELLGVQPDADATEIRAAFRSQMRVRENFDSHPDQGGAGDIALRLINAKNVLLAHARSLEETTS